MWLSSNDNTTLINWLRHPSYDMVLVFNAIFNNISVISWIISFIDGENRSTRSKQPTCRKSLTNLSHKVVSGTHRRSGIRTHNVNSYRYWLHKYRLFNTWSYTNDQRYCMINLVHTFFVECHDYKLLLI